MAQLSVAEGGKCGSPGYTPPELLRRQQMGQAMWLRGPTVLPAICSCSSCWHSTLAVPATTRRRCGIAQAGAVARVGFQAAAGIGHSVSLYLDRLRSSIWTEKDRPSSDQLACGLVLLSPRPQPASPATPTRSSAATADPSDARLPRRASVARPVGAAVCAACGPVGCLQSDALCGDALSPPVDTSVGQIAARPAAAASGSHPASRIGITTQLVGDARRGKAAAGVRFAQ